MNERKQRTSRVIKRFGTWAVTNYGVECTFGFYYPVKKARLWEKFHNGGGEHHVSAKSWTVENDVHRAFAAARVIHAAAHPALKGLRKTSPAYAEKLQRIEEAAKTACKAVEHEP